MIHTTTSTRALTGRSPASTRSHAGLSARASPRTGAHLLMEPRATNSPRGRANTRVRAKISAEVPKPSSRVRVTVQNMSIPHSVCVPAGPVKGRGRLATPPAFVLSCFRPLLLGDDVVGDAVLL